MKVALTEQQLAAIAAGATLESVAPGVTAEQLAAAQAEVDAQASAQAAAQAAEAARVQAEADAAAAAANTNTPNAVVALLQGQLKDAQAQVTSLTVDLAAANSKVAEVDAKLAAASTNTTGLNAIVAKSLSHMRVALRQPALDFSGHTSEALLAEHAKTSELFTKTFKAGGVAAVATPAAAEDKRTDIGAHQQAVAAVRGRAATK